MNICMTVYVVSSIHQKYSFVIGLVKNSLWENFLELLKNNYTVFIRKIIKSY